MRRSMTAMKWPCFPPVSGGSGAPNDNKFAVTFEPIYAGWHAGPGVSARRLGRWPSLAASFATFQTEKDVEHLEYEAYQEMAVKPSYGRSRLLKPGNSGPRSWMWLLSSVSANLEVGEVAVIVAVSSPHRGDGCFEACAYAINRLKEIVPIWKKEVGPDGDEWIEGDYVPSAADSQ